MMKNEPLALADAVEQDVRRLMHELAEARMSLDEARRESEDRLEAILMRLLEVLDAFDRVFEATHAKPEAVTPQMKIWLGNFRSVKRLLDVLLKEEGVRPVENVTGGFDPAWHKVADTVVDGALPEGTIVREVRRGFVRNQKLLRKAEVVVVKNTD